MVMTKPMKQRDVNAALRAAGCTVLSDEGPHTKWGCPCKESHTANIPRHKNISAGVVRDTIKRLECLGKGWLQ